VTASPDPVAVRARHRRPSRTVSTVAALAVAGTVAMVLALVLGGGAPERDPSGLTEVGAGTAWALPVLRLLSDVTAVACIGALLAAAVLLPDDEGRLRPQGRRAVADATLAAAVWSVAALGLAVSTAAVVLGVPASSLTSRLDDVLALREVREIAASAVLAALVAALVSGIRTRTAARWGLALAAVALLPPLLSGHAWGATLRVPATGSRMLHVLAATVWVGGLAAVARYGRRIDVADLPAVVSRLSRTALPCAVAVGVSGLLVALLHLAGRDGSLGDAVQALVNRAYGGIVLAKLAAFALLVVAGWWHRRRMITAMLAGRARPFWYLVAAELAVMVIAIGLAVALSRTP
jgi:putative copper export protein